MQLTVEKRDTKKNPNTLRHQGVLPAVVYGRSEEATPIAVSMKDFEKVFDAAGESTIITLKGLGEEKQALIQEVSVDPVSGHPLHADFYAIEAGQTVTVSVPFEFEGVSEAVKSGGGILVKVMHQLEMEVQPRELPSAIVVDISALTSLDSQIKVKDLTLPPSAKISVDMDEVVAMISVPQEEVEETTGPVDLSQIEMSVERGKKEEEGESEGGEKA